MVMNLKRTVVERSPTTLMKIAEKTDVRDRTERNDSKENDEPNEEVDKLL